MKTIENEYGKVFINDENIITPKKAKIIKGLKFLGLGALVVGAGVLMYKAFSKKETVEDDSLMIGEVYSEDQEENTEE